MSGNNGNAWNLGTQWQTNPRWAGITRPYTRM
jgi:isocitrate lyase